MTVQNYVSQMVKKAYCTRPTQALFHAARPVPVKQAFYREDAPVPSETAVNENARRTNNVR